MEGEGVSVEQDRLRKIANLAQTIQAQGAANAARRKYQGASELPQSSAVLELIVRDARRSEELLDELIELAVEEKRSAHRLLSYANNFLQPIFRIPIEIWSYILELITECSDASKWATLMAGIYLPLPQSFASMNLLCRRLREIAIHTPRCWTDVTICVTNNHLTSPTILNEYLQRSGSLLFRLAIYVDKAHVDNPRLHELLAVVQSHIRRCYQIEVRCGREEMQISQISEIIRDYGWVYPALRS
ncbi:hypothetical protein DL93DRAFT_163041 [Clavulina sp. PMI_390]|nr:hypothetical protein DL93DRAFT_163041 [Clavulina sp. PMI_390]